MEVATKEFDEVAGDEFINGMGCVGIQSRQLSGQQTALRAHGYPSLPQNLITSLDQNHNQNKT